jgi:WD40 repeat protein
MKVVDLRLDSNDNGESPSQGSSSAKKDHPRRLLRLPSGELLAWGGDSGAIRIVEASKDNDSVSSVDGHHAAVRDLIRPWDDDDDEIRAVAVSHDGKRIAVGMEIGSTILYTFDTVMNVDDTADSTESGAKQLHPFLRKEGALKPMAGPMFSAQVRDLQFHPLRPDVLAVASEEGLCVLEWTSVHNDDHDEDDDLVSSRHLEESASEHHNGSGIRSVAFSADGTVLASLAMDGRVCLWDTSPAQPSAYKLLYRAEDRSVTKRDMGAYTGADAWDRSCRPHFLHYPNSTGVCNYRHVLALPGATHVQLLLIHPMNATDNAPLVVPVKTVSSDDDTSLTKGHIETIVAITSRAKRSQSTDTLSMRMVTTGRDSRAILWDVAPNVRFICR